MMVIYTGTFCKITVFRNGCFFLALTEEGKRLGLPPLSGNLRHACGVSERVVRCFMDGPGEITFFPMEQI